MLSRFVGRAVQRGARPATPLRACAVRAVVVPAAASALRSAAGSCAVRAVTVRAMSTKAAANPPPKPEFVGSVGEATESFFDVSSARVGQDLQVPYEVTVSEGARELWQSVFYQHDRVYTSTPFAQKFQLMSHALPFSFMLFQTVSMSHIDDRREVLDLGFANAVYVRPAHAGDTFHRSFYVKGLRTTKDGKSTIFTVHCTLYNQNNALVFEADKTMLFPNVTNSSARNTEFVGGAGTAPNSSTSILPPGLSTSPFEQQLMQFGVGLPPTPASSKRYTSGQLVLHTSARPIGKSMNRSLSTLMRFQHPLLMNTAKYDSELVPGPMVIAATTAATARGLYESLYEFLHASSLLNKASPTDTISAITYVHSCRDIAPGLEELRVTTLGLKGIDVREDLAGVRVPLALFGVEPVAAAAEAPAPSPTPRTLTRGAADRLTADHIPLLNGKIVSQVHRRLLRQSHESPTNVPLL